MPLPPEIVVAVRNATDLVGLIGSYVRLDKKGNSWVGLCPFVKEKTGSFNVVPAKQFYYCFGCQATGDCFNFLMKHEGLSFPEAVRKLAEQAGINIPKEKLDPAALAILQREQRSFAILEEATQRFESTLWTGNEGAEARDYLEARGLPVEVARAFRLGLAAPEWTALHDALRRSGYSTEEIIAAGLAKTSDTGRTYDLFRDRLMIPITDERGRVVAFGGRILKGDGPKYINSPETERYHKGSVLYGWAAAQSAVRQRRRVILVEGYFDVIAMHRAGLTEAVATCGTALTQGHVRLLLKSEAREVFLLTDTDNAGEDAAMKALPLLRDAYQTKRPVLPTPAKDPDDALKLFGPESLDKSLKAAMPLLEAIARRKVKQFGLSADGKYRALDEIVELLNGLKDAEIDDLSRVLKLTVADIRARMGGSGPPPPKPSAPVAINDPARSYSVPDLHILWLALHHRDSIADLVNLVDTALLDPRLLPIVALLQAGDSALDVLHTTVDDDLRAVVGRALAKEGLYTPDSAAQGFVENVKHLATVRINATRAELEDRLAVAQRAEDKAAVTTVLKALQELNGTVREIEQCIGRKDWPAALTKLRLDA